jgi:hypothetical protein
VRNVLLPFCAILFVSGMFVGAANAEEIGVVVSPNVINIDSKGTWVTVHADIAYEDVATATVTLNGIEVNWTKSDAQGNLVAKFSFGEVIDEEDGIVKLGTNELTLSGFTKDDVEFFGTDTIKVIQPSAGK